MSKKRNYSNLTLKKLFALSGNKCAFPNCSHNLVNSDGNFVGDIAHIEGLEPKSARHNPNNQAPNEVDNLMLMCPTHHREIDNKENWSKYPLELLKEWKVMHEEQHIFAPYQVSEDVINNIYNQYNNNTTENIDNSTHYNYNNTGSGSQFNNQAPVSTQIGTQKNYYGGKDLDQSIHDNEIIREIFDFIDDNPEKYPMKNTTGRFTGRGKKIRINFTEGNKRVSDMFLNTQKRLNLVEKYMNELSNNGDDKPLALQEQVQSYFCQLAKVNDTNTRIKDFTVFENLSKMIIPQSKHNDAIYLLNAKAIVLYFFEFCKIGKMTDDEISDNHNDQLYMDF